MIPRTSVGCRKKNHKRGKKKILIAARLGFANKNQRGISLRESPLWRLFLKFGVKCGLDKTDQKRKREKLPHRLESWVNQPMTNH